MAFHAVPNGIEVALHARFGATELVNTFGFRSNLAVPTHAQCVAANAIILGDFLTDYALLCGNDIEFYRSVATALDSPTGAQQITDVSLVGGISASELLPLNVSCVVSIKGNVRGRGRQGRVFCFGMTESATNGNLFVPGYTDDLKIAFDTLPLAPTGDGIQWAVLSRLHGLATPVAGLSVKSAVANQKDRLPGHRRHRRPIA